MSTLRLAVMGLCLGCSEWHEMEGGAGGMPVHKAKDDVEDCRGSRYSPLERKYLIKTDAEAVEVANFIKNDGGRCLDSFTSSGRHSMSCGDGRNCEKERLQLAQALAVFFLKGVHDCAVRPPLVSEVLTDPDTNVKFVRTTDPQHHNCLVGDELVRD